MSRIEENCLIDLDFNPGVNASDKGDLKTITSIENVKQALFHRLITRPGSLAHRPDYGVGVQDFQNALGTFEKQQELAMRIRRQFKQDPRVVAVLSVSIRKDTVTEAFIVTYKVEVVGVGLVDDTVKPFGDFSL